MLNVAIQHSLKHQRSAASRRLLSALLGILASLAPISPALLPTLFMGPLLFRTPPAHHAVHRPAQRGADLVVSNPNLLTASDLTLTELDSTIRANWTPSADPSTAWHVFSVWDGPTLLGTKVLGRTASVADANGLMSGQPYASRVQAMDGAGGLSDPVAADGTP